MAEYKYRALGWKDDDIASLNVVAAADNQVELQITKQGAGGTIDGPAIVGKDGITIDKAADSEKIEISGSGLVQNSSKKGYVVYTRENDVNNSRTFAAQPVPNSFPIWNTNNELEGNISNSSTDYTLTNKKYVDDNYVKKVKSAASNQRVYAVNPDGTEDILIRIDYSNQATTQAIIRRDVGGSIYVPDISIGRTDYNFASGQEAVNKKYVDDADKTLRLKLTNLEQALNGYILDTTKEAYADLDSAVLKNSVAVGDNVYPIADKTRALVTRIEGKTTKMVQLLDKSTYYNSQTISGITATNNGDGSWTINGTATKGDYINFSPELSLDGGHKVLLTGNKTNSAFTLELLNQGIIDRGNGAIGNIKADFEKTFGIAWESGAVINNVTITPQLFDLTAMNREDITSAEQFKAEFPDLYPYENGNIYPAKISGVKFYENQDKSGEPVSVTLPETYDLNGIGDYKDYLEITKNEDNELYTLKKIQVIDKHVFDGTEAWTVSGRVLPICQAFYTEKVKCLFVYEGKGGLSNHLPLGFWGNDIEHIQFGQSNNVIYVFLNKEKFKTGSDVQEYLAAQYASGNPLIAYYILLTPVETVIATNLTYEQVTAIRHNGGLIEVAGNSNKGYARPTVTNTIVYRLTAANTTEG